MCMHWSYNYLHADDFFCLLYFVSMKVLHYNNTPIKYTVIFHGCKSDYLQRRF